MSIEPYVHGGAAVLRGLIHVFENAKETTIVMTTQDVIEILKRSLANMESPEYMSYLKSLVNDYSPERK